MKNLTEVKNKEYHFTIERHDKAKYYAPVVNIPVSDFIRFAPCELLSIRKLFLKHGEKAQFKHLENIDVDLYDEMEEILSDFLYSNAETELRKSVRTGLTELPGRMLNTSTASGLLLMPESCRRQLTRYVLMTLLTIRSYSQLS